MNHSDRPVFHDHTGKRWKLLVRISTAAALVLSILGAAFSFSLVALPLSPLSVQYHSSLHHLIPRLVTHAEAERRFVARRTVAKLNKAIAQENKPRHKKHLRSPGKPYSTVIGFYVNWNERSFESLRDHIKSLTYVMPQWLYLTPDGRSYQNRFGQSTDDKNVIALSIKNDVPIIPMLDNVEQGKGFQWDRLQRLLSSRSAQRKLALELRDYLLQNHFAGINLDLEVPLLSDLTPVQKKAAEKIIHDKFPELVQTFHKVFRPAHLLVTQDLPANNSNFDYNSLGDANDFVVVMLYDESNVFSDPGPIAGQDWIEDVADKVFSRMDSEKVVLGIGNYCYDWKFKYNSYGDKISLGNYSNSQPYIIDALGKAKDAGAEIQMDRPDLNPYFTYSDEQNIDHIVYMLDAVTAYNQITALRGYEPRGAALWHLGSEDPSIWDFFTESKLSKKIDPAKLKSVNYHNVMDQGDGELEEVVAQPSPGIRRIKTDADGLIIAEPFISYPTSFILDHMGNLKGNVALTFDDGPDPRYTPQILDILRKEKAPATFFMIGQHARDNQEIVRDIWQSGNEIGNHTFYHPMLADVSAVRTQLEVNSTQRLIESITGYATRLFRPPYGDGADVNATDPKGVAMLERVQNLGYITVGFNIDPKDFLRPGVDKIVDRIDTQLDKCRKDNIDGNVVLLHDAGGNRDQTIAALPRIIRNIRAKGYRLVTVSQLLGKNGHSSMFIPVPHAQGAIEGVDRLVFEGTFLFLRILQIAFLSALVLGILRILLIAPMAVLQSRRSVKYEQGDYTPPITAIIPAYNEEKVIARTVQGLLDSNYPDLRVIVVDDGSTDATADVVKSEFASEPRLTLIRKSNGGKASALNLGISNAETEIVVCCDGDTVFARDAVRHLVSQFIDPKVGAVAGNVKVGNRTNPLTTWQSLEYITSQNFDRRAYALFNSVAIVPGAIGAWRKSAIMRAGGYQSDTLAEDADLTFRIRLLGYDTRSQNDALAFTEAPDSISALAKQRFRWSFGILQALWKHKNAMFCRRHGVFGMLVMPTMWIFNIAFQALSPIVDVAVVISLIHNMVLPILLYFAALFTLDFMASLVAFKLDKESPSALVWLFWQRFFYRQFMYYVIIKSIIAALRGEIVGWGKLQRKATATLPGVGE